MIYISLFNNDDEGRFFYIVEFRNYWGQHGYLNKRFALSLIIIENVWKLLERAYNKCVTSCFLFGTLSALFKLKILKVWKSEF